MKQSIRLMLLLAMTVISSLTFAQQNITLSVDRSLGLLIGDIVTVKVDFDFDSAEIDKSSLPILEQRYGLWLSLRKVELQGQQALFQYQIVNVPTENTAITTPSFTLKRGDNQELIIPEATVSIGSFLTAADRVQMKMKADKKPIFIATEPAQKALLQFSVLFVILAIIFALWQFGWKTKNRAPFAQAVHDLMRLKWLSSSEPEQATRILHNAFNQTAATIVVNSELNEFLQQYPWLLPLSDEIEHFFKQSSSHFFTQDNESALELNQIIALAKQCRAKERLA